MKTLNRRHFLSIGVGAAGLTFCPSLVNADLSKSGKSVILIHMQGGVSNVDFLNPLPNSPAEYRSTRGYVNTKSGFEIAGDFTELAKWSDHYSVVRSLKTRDANHATATMEWMTGHKHVPNNPQKEPSPGSIFLRKNGTVTDVGVPHYVKIRQIGGDDAAWMGVKYAGMDYGAEQIRDMTLNIPDGQFSRRLSILKSINTAKDLGQQGKDYSELQDQAVGIIRGQASNAFKIELEPDHIKQLYGTSRFGKDLLLARRLVESGSRIVTLNSNSSWDNHSNIDTAFERNAAGFDVPLAALISDLVDRGMIDDVLVVTVSEFSRTKMNINSGKDHNPNTNGSLMIGGGYSHGRTIGATDKTGLVSVDNVFGPQDMLWTILDHLGVDKKYLVYDNVQRPRPLIHDDAKNILMT